VSKKLSLVRKNSDRHLAQKGRKEGTSESCLHDRKLEGRGGTFLRVKGRTQVKGEKESLINELVGVSSRMGSQLEGGGRQVRGSWDEQPEYREKTPGRKAVGCGANCRNKGRSWL